jgi:iron complex transport system substrate-binding protein
MTRIALLLMMVLPVAAVTRGETESSVLSIGGSVTEIVYALGQAHRLVARDSTSTWPPEAEQLPDVGYMRALSPEGVLSVDPELIIAEDGSGPPETIDILTSADIRFVIVPDNFSADGIVEKIMAVGDALGVPGKAIAFAADVEGRLNRAMAAADAAADAAPRRRRVLFVLSTRGGRILAAGSNTAADGIITMAGGVNAVTGFEGYKPMTDEAVTTAAPDVVLMMRSAGAVTSDEELFAMPAINATPAGRNRAIVRIPGLLLLGFGPRTPEAIEELSDALYSDTFSVAGRP